MSINETVDEIKTIEVRGKNLSFEEAQKKLYIKVVKQTKFGGNIDDAVERNEFFAKYEVLPLQDGDAIVGLKLNYSLKNPIVPEKKERKASSGCGPAINYTFE